VSRVSKIIGGSESASGLRAALYANSVR